MLQMLYLLTQNEEVAKHMSLQGVLPVGQPISVLYGYVSLWNSGPLLIVSPALKRCGPLWRYVATRPTCGPLLILSPL